MATKDATNGLLRVIPGLSFRKSRFGSSDAYFHGSKELAHFHGDTELDLRLGKTAGRLVKHRLGDACSPHGDWVTLDLININDDDLRYALAMLVQAG